MSAKPGQPRHLLVEARVVLHRAGAERIEARVDRVVLLRRAARSGAPPRGSERPGRPIGALRARPPRRSRGLRRFRQIDAGRIRARPARRSAAPRDRDRDRRRSYRARRSCRRRRLRGRPCVLSIRRLLQRAGEASMSASVLVSVAATISRLASSGSRRIEARGRHAAEDARARPAPRRHRRAGLRQLAA